MATESLEELIRAGDLSRLTPEQKSKYYEDTCKRLNLDPATVPFAFIKFQGREVLYPSRTATDQMAANNGLTREIVNGPGFIEVAGAKPVTATCRVSTPSGRTETATATLPLKDPANDLMKVESKAKRRATLSILGLGFQDDEPEAKPLPDNVVRLPVKQPKQLPETTPQPTPATPTGPELLEYASQFEQGKAISNEELAGLRTAFLTRLSAIQDPKTRMKLLGIIESKIPKLSTAMGLSRALETI